jgi:hypothetical protein
LAGQFESNYARVFIFRKDGKFMVQLSHRGPANAPYQDIEGGFPIPSLEELRTLLTALGVNGYSVTDPLPRRLKADFETAPCTLEEAIGWAVDQLNLLHCPILMALDVSEEETRMRFDEWRQQSAER